MDAGERMTGASLTGSGSPRRTMRHPNRPVGVLPRRDRPPAAAKSRGRAVRARRRPHRPRRHHRGRRVPAARRTSTARPTAASTPRSSSCSSGASRSTSSRSPRRSSAREELEAIGGRAYLSQPVSNQTPTAVHAAQYARIVERKAVLRNLIGAAGKIAGIGYEDPAEIQEAIDRAESELFAVSQKRVDAGFSAAQVAAPRRLRPARLPPRPPRRDQRRPDRASTDLDALTTGLQKSDLIIVAARPSVGKTSFALNIAEHAAVKERKSVGVFSLEMSKEQLVLRLLSSVANIDSQRLRTGFLEELDFARIAPAMNALSEAPMYIDDTPNISGDGAADQGAPAPGGGRPRPRRRRLPAAHAGDHDEPRRQPRPGGRRDLARAQGARARAVGPGHRPVAAVAPAGDARVARSRACRTCASRAPSSRTRTS